MPSINKREFLVAATVASVCVALDGSRGRAQQNEKPRVLGILVNGRPSPAFDGLRRGFVEDFAKLGIVEGKDLTIETRFAHDQLDRFPELVAELVELKVDVILALGGVSAAAAAKVTKATPIVYFIVTDPVALGLAASYDRPGGNVTGVHSIRNNQASRSRCSKRCFRGSNGLQS